MHNLISDLFKKRGIKDVTELSEEEKNDFKNWQAILSKEELTIEDIKKFCQTQCDVIKGKWQDYNTRSEEKAELIPYFTVYNTLLAAIDSPKVAREALEKQLVELINN